MQANFVDVVGYQLEKIHVGVISWLLSGSASPIKISDQGKIIEKLSSYVLKEGDITKVKSYREYSFGRQHSIDLVIEAELKNQGNAYLLIECKTDSDVKVEQLKASEEIFINKNKLNQNDLVIVISLAVGAGQFTLEHLMQKIHENKYHAINLKQTIDIFSNLSKAGPCKVYNDWIAALTAEDIRASQIDIDLQKLNKPGDVGLLHAGYRKGFPVYYMFYDKIRKFLVEGPYQNWAIYSGSNNPVMNWKDGRVTVAGEDKIVLFWEFNRNNFCLKARLNDNNRHIWKTIRKDIITLCEISQIAGRKTNNKPGKWVTAYKWEFDFCKETPQDIANKVNKILSSIHMELRNIQNYINQRSG